MTDDSDTYHVYTRRETLQGAGTGAATLAYPLSHKSGDDGGVFGGVKDFFSSDPDLVVTDADGNVITEDPDEFRFDGSAVTGIEEVGHPDDTIVRITVDGGNGFWTETADGEVTPADGQPVHAESIESGRSRTDYSDGYPYFPNQEFDPLPHAAQPVEGVTETVLTVDDVSGSTAVTSPDFVADQFVFFDEESQLYHLFVEVFSRSSGESTISHATGVEPSTWTVQGDLLSVVDTANSNTRNYPYVFRSEFHGGRVFLNHHQGSDDAVYLYELTIDGTSVSATLIGDPLFTPSPFTGQPEDPTMFYWDGYWYTVIHTVSTSPNEKHIFYTDDLLNGSWSAHDQNPVIASDRLAPNGGFPILHGDARNGNGWIEFFCRGNDANNDAHVWTIAITDLSPTSFSWHEVSQSPILTPANDNTAWNGTDMHHISPIRGQYAIVDGQGINNDWEIGLYSLENAETPRWDSWAQRESIRSDAVHFETFYESLDGKDQSTSGSASISLPSNRVELSTGTTSGSHAQLSVKLSGQYTKTQHTWDRDREALFPVNFPDVAGTKWLVSGLTGTSRHIGFKLSGGDLLGTVADGSTEATTTLISGLSAGDYNLRVEFTAGSEAVFYVDEMREGSLSSNLPSGTGSAEFFATQRVENSTSSDRLLRFKEARVAQYA